MKDNVKIFISVEERKKIKEAIAKHSDDVITEKMIEDIVLMLRASQPKPDTTH